MSGWLQLYADPRHVQHVGSEQLPIVAHDVQFEACRERGATLSLPVTKGEMMRGSLNHTAPLPCECFILKCAFLEILRRLSNNSFHMQSSIRFTHFAFFHIFQFFIFLHFLSLSFIVFHCLSLSFIIFHYLSFSFIFFHFPSFSFIFLHCPSLSFIVLHFPSLSLSLLGAQNLIFSGPQFRHDFS